MKIGVWLGFELKEGAGGAFSYIDRLIKMIDDYPFQHELEVCFIDLIKYRQHKKEICPILDLPAIVLSIAKKNRLIYKILKHYAEYKIKKKGLRHFLGKQCVSIVYYLHQGQCVDSNFPFISTNWDIGHRSTHAFPELIWEGKSFENRDLFYHSILPKSLMVFCESEAGKKELMDYTRIGDHKLRVLPMFGGAVTTVSLSKEESKRIINDYGLVENKFFFYPAQFWAHKNHVGLIRAFARVSKRYKDYKLVLSGSDKGNFEYVKSLIAEYAISDKVVFLGFVSIETLYSMYKCATALVMASHFGPTNMPPIEAMEIGCPVACSDLGGHHEILGDAACFFNSFSVDSMYKSLIKIIEKNDYYRNRIVEQRRVSLYNPKTSMVTLEKLLLEVKTIRENWN